MLNWQMVLMPILALIVILLCYITKNKKHEAKFRLMGSYESALVFTLNLAIVILVAVKFHQKTDSFSIILIIYLLSTTAVSFAIYKRRTVSAVMLLTLLLTIGITGFQEEYKIKRRGVPTTWKTEIIRFATSDISTKKLKLWINGVDYGSFKPDVNLDADKQYCSVKLSDLKRMPEVDTSSSWFEDINNKKYGSKFYLPKEEFTDFSRRPSMTQKQLDKNRLFYAYSTVGNKIVGKRYFSEDNYTFDNKLFNNYRNESERTKIAQCFIVAGYDKDSYQKKIIETCQYRALTNNQFDSQALQRWDKEFHVLATCNKIGFYELNQELLAEFIVSFYKNKDLSSMIKINQFIESLPDDNELLKLACKGVYQKAKVQDWLLEFDKTCRFKIEDPHEANLNSIKKYFYLHCLKYYYDSEISSQGYSEIGQLVIEKNMIQDSSSYLNFYFTKYFPEDATTFVLEKYNKDKPPIFVMKYSWGLMGLDDLWSSIFSLKTKRAKKLQRYALVEFLNTYEKYCKSFEGNGSTFGGALIGAIGSEMRHDFVRHWPQFRKKLVTYLRDGNYFSFQWRVLSAMGDLSTPEMYCEVFKDVVENNLDKFRYQHLPFTGQKELELRLMIDSYMKNKTLLGVSSNSELNNFMNRNSRRLQELSEVPPSAEKLIKEIGEIVMYPTPESLATLKKLKKHRNEEVSFKASSALSDLNKLKRRPMTDFPIVNRRKKNNE